MPGTARVAVWVGVLLALVSMVAWPMRALARERDRLRVTLSQSERLFARLAVESPSGTLYFDALGQPIFANDRWSILTGHADLSLSGQRWLEAIAPADRSAVNSLWARARATLEPCACEIAYLSHGQSAGHAEIAFYPEVEAGRVMGFAARLTDITARRLDQAAQEEREARYRQLSEHGQDVVVRLTLDGCARYVSGASLRVIGYTPVEVVGHSLAEFVHRDDLPLVERSLARLAARRPDPPIEFRLRHRDGHFGWFESRQRLVFDRHGDPFEVVASLRDIGDRRRAEAEAAEAAASRDDSLRLLALVEEAAGSGHWRLDAAARTLKASPLAHCVLGHAQDERLRPVTMLRAVHVDDRRTLLACLARARRAAEPAACSLRLGTDATARRVHLVAQADYRGDVFTGWSGAIAERDEDDFAGAAMVRSATAARTAPAAGGSRTLKVLLAQHNALRRAMEAASLARIGHAVTTVATGREAVTMATWHAYDAIVIDLRLRDMDALAATRAIRGSAGPCAEAIIIALSDDASPERQRFYDGAGFSHVLAKPGKHALAARLDAISAILGRRADARRATAPAAPLVERERISELRALLGSERVAVLLRMLVAECCDRPPHIRKAFCRGELAAIRAEGHGLKGAALTIGATALGRVAEELEAVASVALAEPLIAALEDCADSTRNAVLTLLASPTDDRASA